MPCGLTPAAADLSLYLIGGLTACESAEVWGKPCGQGPSVASLMRLSEEAGTSMVGCSDDILEDLRQEEELPEVAVSVLVSLNGVMMRMRAGTTDEPSTDAVWREVSCGVVGLVDASGHLLESRSFGRLPEAGRTNLKGK